MTRTRILVMSAFATAVALQGGQKPVVCPAFDSAARSKLASYVQGKYKLASSGQVDITFVSFVEDTCYRRLEFMSSSSAPKFKIELIASPDLRFLTRELLDSRADPAEEDRKREAATTARLAEDPVAAIGRTDAPVTLVLFSDFECPFCSQMAKALRKDIVPAAGDNVRFIFRNFPLPMHPWAETAAAAGICARQQDGEYFWMVHDYLFDHQREIAGSNLTQALSALLAQSANFDSERFDACIVQPGTVAEVQRDIALGKEMKVAGTPTLFVNGQRVNGYRPEQIRTLIRELTPVAH